MNDGARAELLRYAKKAKGSLLFGIPLEQLSSEELLGAVVFLGERVISEREERWAQQRDCIGTPGVIW